MTNEKRECYRKAVETIIKDTLESVSKAQKNEQHGSMVGLFTVGTFHLVALIATMIADPNAED